MIGCLIGSTWEFTFHFLGDEFAYAVKQWPLGLSGWPKQLSHSIWDGGLFMFGIWLCFLPISSLLHSLQVLLVSKPDNLPVYIEFINFT